ncbi:hypothetical protein CDCA_CDCA08G2491 [Cyanidium caldarium]|uniref:CGL160/ATPI domain-containing protein n=1 Tax=Cyanidium caldarium TaxID=2771 RepID=A0AAV9IWC8_CYACA|nr:hypothetical protein CDCA_CDCA08G2491 [Cyanidium caldarium]
MFLSTPFHFSFGGQLGRAPRRGSRPLRACDARPEQATPATTRTEADTQRQRTQRDIRRALAFEQQYYGPDRYGLGVTPTRRGGIGGVRQTRGRDASRTEYAQLQRRLLRDTVVVGAVGTAVTAVCSSEVDVVSFGLGASASVLYVFLLERHVDRMVTRVQAVAADTADSEEGDGDDSGGSAAWMALGGGPIRLSVLVALIVGVSRFRESLHLLPALLGFLTYKVATVLPALDRLWRREGVEGGGKPGGDGKQR